MAKSKFEPPVYPEVEENPEVEEEEVLTRNDFHNLMYEAKTLSAFVRAFADEASTRDIGRQMSADEFAGLFDISHRIYELTEKAERITAGYIDINWGGKHA